MEIVLMIGGDVTGLESCPVVGCGVMSAEPSSSCTRLLVN